MHVNMHCRAVDRVALELLGLRFFTRDFWQARDSVPLKATMQCRPGQMRKRWLQGIEAIVQRQERVPPECDDHRLFIFAENCGARLSRSGLSILNSLSLAPLGNRLGIDPQLSAQLRDRSLPLSGSCCA